MAARTDSTEWEHRVDRGELLASKPGPGGSLLVTGYAAREGVLVYRDAAGRETRELVPLSTLEASAPGLARATVTLEHPREDVSPSNVAQLGVGDVGSRVTLHDDGYVEVQLAVRRQDALDAIRGGKVELSPGYRVRLDPTPGTHPVHGRYDAIQVEREYNHLAIVGNARGGATVRLRADAAAATTVISGTPPATPSKGQPARGATVNSRFLPLLSLLGITSRIDSDDAAIDAATHALQQRKDAADKDRTDAKAALDAMTAERDAAKARADKAEAEVKALKDAEAARADKADRERLDGIATRLGLDPKAHADSRALRRAIASKHLGSEVRADASDDYVAALVDLASTSGTQRSDGREAGRQVWDAPPPARQDGQEPPARQDGAPKRRPTANELRLQQIEAARKARQ